jgi:hypothetical protein
MFVEKIYNGFSNIVDVGRYSYFIYLGNNGIFMNDNEIIENAKHFNHIIIYGEEVNKQKDHISNFLKKLLKFNPSISISIHVNALFTFSSVSSFINNTKFFVFVPLKNTGIDWPKRIDEKVMKWYMNTECYFIFEVNNLNDLDEVYEITNMFEIRKKKVFVVIKNNYEEVKNQCRLYGFNLGGEVEW